MEARKKYEEEILQKVHRLPDEQLPKVVSMLDKLQAEAGSEVKYSDAIERAWGLLSDGLSSSDAFAMRKQEEKELDK
ncbi:hypothetical protein [Paracnuella aquatica]|nr:hypothetical protein [Paracnuella aquatica]RPD43795.1 hypothetical protein DRJ53_18585 [Paracnuella aquatica]